jgi:sugar/nucleoside kinase (ribokinase family)
VVCIASVGELLVEFVCSEKDGRNLRAGTYAGPFASGAPGIFIDQVARLGGRAVFAGAVGDDAFGRVILDRLRASGVGLDLIRVVPGVPTGTAHVSYNTDGTRDFVFNIARSAASFLPSVDAIVAGCQTAGVTVVHISGSMLGDAAMRATGVAVCDALHAAGVAISIDPNIRAELVRDAGYLGAVRHIMGMARYVLSSGVDAAVLFPGQDFADWSARLGAAVVVFKRGDQGCVGRDRHGTVALAAHSVDVVDATGAGDCFCATLVTLMAQGMAMPAALARANAAGAMAVTQLGPMEGNATLAQIEGFLECQ